MNRKDIELHLSSEDKLVVLLDEYNEQFAFVDEVADQLRSGVIDTPDVVDSTMKQLMGVYASLNTVVFLLDTEYELRLSKEFFRLRIDYDSKEKKTSDKTVENEAKLNMATWKRVSTVFDGYLNNTEKLISGFQSSLKSLQSERFHAKV